MSFRSGINQVNGSNPAPIQLYTQTNIVNPGLRNEIPINFGPGTYKCSMSNQLNVTGTGSIQLLIFYTGLSGINGATVAVTPQPISATNNTSRVNQLIDAGTGFSTFQETFISIDEPRTIWLYNLVNYSLTSSPMVTMTQNLTITPIIG
jgi:hypothetical protein